MARSDYPIDMRADHPAHSSRGWAALTILLIKLLALIPHGIALLFLGIAQVVAAFVAQIVVAFGRPYPAGIFGFVAGVLRWNVRVTAFIFSLTDRYPPFSLQPLGDYPVDVRAERPAQHSRLYAVFTVVVQLAAVAGAVWLVVALVRNPEWFSSASSDPSASSEPWSGPFDAGSYSSGGLLLRQIATLPHIILLAILGMVAFAVWLVVQWVILFIGRYPRSLFDFVVGVTRWQTRVTGYGLRLTDAYPPFGFEPSVGAPDEGARPAAAPLPPAPAPQPVAPATTGEPPEPEEGPGEPPEPAAPAPSAPEPPPPPTPPSA